MARICLCLLAIMLAGLCGQAQAAQPEVYWKHLYTTYDFHNSTIIFNGQVINNLRNRDVVRLDQRTLKYTYKLTINGQSTTKTLEYTAPKELVVRANTSMRYYFKVKMPQGFSKDSEVTKVSLDFKYTTKAAVRAGR